MTDASPCGHSQPPETGSCLPPCPSVLPAPPSAIPPTCPAPRGLRVTRTTEPEALRSTFPRVSLPVSPLPFPSHSWPSLAWPPGDPRPLQAPSGSLPCDWSPTVVGPLSSCWLAGSSGEAGGSGVGGVGLHSHTAEWTPGGERPHVLPLFLGAGSRLHTQGSHAVHTQGSRTGGPCEEGSEL